MQPTTTTSAAPVPIEVTVIGGYLGAGKTTLVNAILRQSDQRVAVLVNDFGDINIDQDLIVGQSGDTISLANGCICCSLVDGFAAALSTIQALDPRPERLVIEASGVADPATVAAYGHGPGLQLDAIIVVADAETIRAKSTDVYVGDAVLAQLRSGDIIVLNKNDLVSGDMIEVTRRWLQDVAATAVILETSQAVVDPAVLFGVEAPQQHNSAAGTNHDHPHHVHGTAQYESWTWTSDQPVERSGVETLMANLPDGVMRAKGVIFLAEAPEQAMVLQRVGKRWTLRRLRGDGGGTSRLVLIGFYDAISTERIHELLG